MTKTDTKPRCHSLMMVPPDSALHSGCSHIRFWLAAALGLALDLVSKKWALARLGSLDDPQPLVLIPDWLRLSLVLNHGAVAGIAHGKTTLLIVGAFIAMGFLFWLYITTKKSQKLAHISLGLLLAGALGNTYDRLFNAGQVVDFIEVDLHFPPAHPWPTFNVADILLCVGLILLLTGVFFGAKMKKPAGEAKI